MVNKFVKKEIEALKNMTLDAIPRFVSTFLRPEIWRNFETAGIALASFAASFAADRMQSIFAEIKNKESNIDMTVLESDQTKQTLLQLAKYTYNENPDVDVWDSIKVIFIKTLDQDMTEKQRQSYYEMINICRELKGTEIRILAASFIILNTKPKPTSHRNVNLWAKEVARLIGLQYPEEVMRYEDNLVKQKLINPRTSLSGTTYEDWVGGEPFHRLTQLGIKLASELATK